MPDPKTLAAKKAALRKKQKAARAAKLKATEAAKRTALRKKQKSQRSQVGKKRVVTKTVAQKRAASKKQAAEGGGVGMKPTKYGKGAADHRIGGGKPQFYGYADDEKSNSTFYKVIPKKTKPSSSKSTSKKKAKVKKAIIKKR